MFDVRGTYIRVAVTDNVRLSDFDSWRKRRRRLKLIGVLVLVLGLGSAGFVYWRGLQSSSVMDDLSMVGYSRAQTRQMENLYGKMGPMINDWMAALKQPGTQAIIIAAVSLVVGTGCLLFDRHLYDGSGTQGGDDAAKLN